MPTGNVEPNGTATTRPELARTLGRGQAHLGAPGILNLIVFGLIALVAMSFVLSFFDGPVRYLVGGLIVAALGAFAVLIWKRRK